MTVRSLSSRLGRLAVTLGAGAIAAAIIAGPAAAATSTASSSTVSSTTASSSNVSTHATKPKPGTSGNTYTAAKPKVVPKPAHVRQQAVAPLIAWSVNMTVSSTRLWGTQTSTITATANADVAPTPYWIIIWQDGTRVAECGSGTSCTLNASFPTPQTHGYSAEIGYYDGSQEQASYPGAGGGFSACDGVCVEWHGVDFTMSVGYSTLPINGVTAVTATASEDVLPSPFYIDIVDATTGTVVGTPCGGGTVCSATVSQAAAGTHKYVAYLAGYASALPLTNVQNTSSPTWVTWAPGGFQLSLSGPAAVTGWAYITATANVDLTNTPYYIEIFNDDSGTFVGSCKLGTVCTLQTSGDNYGVNRFVAFISSSDSTYSPANIQASSNVIAVRIDEIIP